MQQLPPVYLGVLPMFPTVTHLLRAREALSIMLSFAKALALKGVHPKVSGKSPGHWVSLTEKRISEFSHLVIIVTD